MITRRALFPFFLAAPHIARGLDFDALPLQILVAEHDELNLETLSALHQLDLFRLNGLSIEVKPTPREKLFANIPSNTVILGDLNAFLLLKGKGEISDLKAFHAVSDRPTFSIITRRSRGIETLQQLQGKMIGASTHDLSQIYFPSVLKLNNLALSDYKLEYLGRNLREAMLASGEIDAVLGSACTVLANLKARSVPQEDILALNFVSLGSSLFGSALMAQEKLIYDNKDAFLRLQKVFSEGILELNKNPDILIKNWQKKFNVSAKNAEDIVMHYFSESIFTPFSKQTGLGEFDLIRFEAALSQLAFEAPYVQKPTLQNSFIDL